MRATSTSDLSMLQYRQISLTRFSETQLEALTWQQGVSSNILHVMSPARQPNLGFLKNRPDVLEESTFEIRFTSILAVKHRFGRRLEIFLNFRIRYFNAVQVWIIDALVENRKAHKRVGRSRSGRPLERRASQRIRSPITQEDSACRQDTKVFVHP